MTFIQKWVVNPAIKNAVIGGSKKDKIIKIIVFIAAMPLVGFIARSNPSH
jgi:hypothetical protein